MQSFSHLITPSLCFQALNNMQYSQVHHKCSKRPLVKQIPKSQDNNSDNLQVDKPNMMH